MSILLYTLGRIILSKPKEGEMISYEEFLKVDMRAGTIGSVKVLKEARKPAYKQVIDFGELATKKDFCTDN